MRLPRRPSISLPISLGITTIALTVALLVGWTLVIVRNASITSEWAANTWLLVFGIFSFVMIITVLVLLSTFLVREILEGNRQTHFIDSVTHELKSPLAAVRLCLETLGRENLSEPQRKQFRQMMLSDVDRLNTFVDDILVASRLQYDRDAPSFQTCSTLEAIKHCVSAAETRQRLEPGTIRVEGSDTLLETDRTALETILKNLIDNAIKYSGDNPDVSIRLEGTTEGCRVVVQDQGVGIPRKHIRRVFERFYRVPDESVRARRGTGLGLFVAGVMARKLGWKLEAFSEGPGRGTRMTLRIPRARGMKT